MRCFENKKFQKWDWLFSRLLAMSGLKRVHELLNFIVNTKVIFKPYY